MSRIDYVWTNNTDLRNDLLSASSILKLYRILIIGVWKYILRLLMILQMNGLSYLVC